MSAFSPGDAVMTCFGPGIVTNVDDEYHDVLLNRRSVLGKIMHEFHSRGLKPCGVVPEIKLTHHCVSCDEDMIFYLEDYVCAYCRDRMSDGLIPLDEL